jgi:hypothetical protein
MFFINIYELKNFQSFLKQLFLHEILTILARFFFKFYCFQCKEGVIVYKCIEQVYDITNCESI